MKKLLFLTFLLFSATAPAQNKVCINGLLKLKEMGATHMSRSESATRKIEVAVMMNPGWSAKTLENHSAAVVSEITDDILVVSLPANEVIAFSEQADVAYVEFGTTYEVALNYARPACSVDVAQDGFPFQGSTYAFNGAGVVTGLMDVGIDPNNPMFLTPDGEPRVKEAYDYNNNVSATTPSAVKQFTTDNSAQTHGTHVAGIMAGKAYGKGRYCLTQYPDGGVLSQRMGEIPFYGVATGSDIVMCGGSLSADNILKGAKAVADYAKYTGQPFVLNLSMSNTQGPHDGSGVVEQGLSKLGRDGIICIASGNNGADPLFVGKRFSTKDNTLKTFIKGNRFTGIDIWTNSKTPVTVSLGFYDNGSVTSVAEVSAAGETAMTGGAFNQYMEGWACLTSEVNAANNRFHVNISGDFWEKTPGHNVVLTVTGTNGQQVYCYGYGSAVTKFTSYGLDSFSDGSTNGSANNMAAAKNTISVGAFNSSSAWGMFEGGVYWYAPKEDYPIGGMAPYTAYGRSYNNVDVPMVCAPGTAIKSSLSRYYTDEQSADELKKTCAKLDADPMTAYWAHMMGTSMACPFVAGTIALWLQADPTLSYGEVVELIEQSSEIPSGTDSETRQKWGTGKINALTGLKTILNNIYNGIQGVVADSDAIITFTGDRTVNVSVASASSISAALYDLQGKKVAAAADSSSEATIDASTLSAGVYILRVATPHGAATAHRIALK